MTGTFVVDSSVAIAWAVPSQGSSTVFDLLESIAAYPIVVPMLWAFEVANVLLVLLRRRVIADDQYERARNSIARLNSDVDEMGPQLALGEISGLARAYSLSVYDAVYLELALRRGLPLATRDAALNKAAKALGVRTLL